MARKNQATTLNLDLLNRAGLDRTKSMLRLLKGVGKSAEKGAVFLGPALVAYDTVQAYKNNQEWGRVLFSGGAGVGAGFAMGAMATTAEWGALSIGVLAGDAALGGAILAFSPVWGVALAVVVGVAVVGYTTYKVSGYVEELWDSDWAKQKRSDIESKLKSVWEFIKSAWGSRHYLSLYGSNHRSSAVVA